MKGNKKRPQMVGDAQRTCEEAFQNGLKLQKEVWQLWNPFLKTSLGGEGLQKSLSNLTSWTEKVLPVPPKRGEEILDMMQRNTQAVAELAKKAERVTSPMTQNQAQWLELSKSYLETVRSGADAMLGLYSWMECLQKNMAWPSPRHQK